MSDFACYDTHHRGPDAIAVFCSLYAKLAEAASPIAVQERAIRYWLYYMEKVVSAGRTLGSRSTCYAALTTLR